MEPDEIPLDATVPNIVDDNKWKATLERAIPAIVAIRFMTVRHFDTYNAGSSSATGFVVDARRGIILTNRHVVRPGPGTLARSPRGCRSVVEYACCCC